MKSQKIRDRRTKARLRRHQKVNPPADKSNTTQFSHWLDCLKDISTAAYALTTAEIWTTLWNTGMLSIPDGGLLAMATLLLLSAWWAIGHLKAQLN